MSRTPYKALCGLALSIWIVLIPQGAAQDVSTDAKKGTVTGCCTSMTGQCNTATNGQCAKAANQASYVAGGTCVGNVCTAPGMGSDPIFRGFDGSTFEFFGRPGANYSLLTNANLALNMQLVPAGPLHIRQQDGEGTFAGGIGAVLPAFELVAHADEAGNMTFTVNGESVNIELPHSWSQVTYEPYVPGRGQMLTVMQTPFLLKIIAVKSFTDAESGYNRGHLDVEAQVTGPTASHVSGALGQTLNAYDSSRLAEANFEVPSLEYHRFETAHVSSRRLLLQNYPLYASLT